MGPNLTTPPGRKAGLPVAVRQNRATPGRNLESFAAREKVRFPDATPIASDRTKEYLKALRAAEMAAWNIRQSSVGTGLSERPPVRLPAAEHDKAEDRAHVALAFLCSATLVCVLGTLLPRAQNWHAFVEFVQGIFA
jgi:hypothetical protein